MAWTKVWVDIGSGKGISETTSSTDGNLTITNHILEVWNATSDSVTETPTTAQSASAGGVTVPSVGSYYARSGLEWMYCYHVLATRLRENPFQFEITVEYTRKITIATGDAWAAKVSFAGSKYTQDAYLDKDAGPITNSAGQSFNPTLKADYFDEQITVSFKTTTPPDLSTYRGKVNSDSVSFTIGGISRSYTARQLKCLDGTMSTEVTLGDGTTGGAAATPVYDVTIQFLARSDTFIDKVLDEGLMQLDASGAVSGASPDCSAANLINCKDKFGNDTSTPVRLDGSGQQLAPCGTPVFLSFKIEKEHTLAELFTGL